MIRLLGLIVAGLIGGGWILSALSRPDLSASFDPRRFGEGVQVYFESTESRFDDITPGVQKRVIWRDGFKEQRSPVSILYVHGFSATSEEIRPVPDILAERLNANLVYTRLTGHGRPGAAMGEAQVSDWMADMAEALAAARAVGDRVVILSTSTGGTLTAAALQDPVLAERVAAAVFVSPNFRINQLGDRVLTWPLARLWLPWILGPTRSFEPADPDEARYWTVSYPSVAVLPMAELVAAVDRMDMRGVTVPALFWFSNDDQVVRPDATWAMAARWGGPVTVQTVTMGPGDDPSSHVVTGAIMSPGQVDPAADEMEHWVRQVLD
ncbi:MAG: lysophospholipase [Marinibacterium sp.]|nr:lysophospholipase [Marinibacterium sp.]